MESRDWVLEGLYCLFHNEGYNIEGNTEKSDVSWLAQRMHEKSTHRMWGLAPQEERNQYLKFAELAWESFPDLCQRIAARYISMSNAILSLQDIERHGH
jgi:hypothetical protein